MKDTRTLIAQESDYDIRRVRADFPALHQEVYGNPLIYLDNAATTQKPQAVIDRLTQYYTLYNSNIHRGVHFLSQRATEAYEASRVSLAAFINAASENEIIFTSGATESINLVAATYGRAFFTAGDEIVVSHMEHHSNIVPWQMLCEEKGLKLRVIPVNERGEIIYEEYLLLLNERTRLVALAHVSNSLGTINPVERMIHDAHVLDIPVLVDGAQAVPHMKVDVQALDCDFFCFSGHKMYGPTGIGVLYGKSEILEKMPPFKGGGDMIESVTFDKTIYNDVPHNFEAGTPNIAGGIGLHAAVEYLTTLGLDRITRYESSVVDYATAQLSAIDGIRIFGTADRKASVISFLIGSIHPYDAGTILDRLGIAVRTGHHCTQPLMNRFGIPGTIRASFGIYNTRDDVDALVAGIHKVKAMFS